jgi:hypothetical protein
MATANSPDSTEISNIQRRMAQIRREMHQDVQGAVHGAQSLTDWRSLIRGHPWVALGLAAVAGYLIVPKRVRETQALAAPSGTPPEATPITARNQPAPARHAEASTIGTVFSLVAPVAVRAAQNYALKRFERWLEEHPLHPMAQGRDKAHESGAVPASSTGPRLRSRSSP